MPSDSRPSKRIRDKDALRRFHLAHSGEPCAACGVERGTDPHHGKFRSQGGDDIESNLFWVCRRCHRALHGNPYVDANGKRWNAAAVRAALSDSVT